MTAIERKDLLAAVLSTRDAIDPSFESVLLEAIVDAEANSAGDGEAAMRDIDAAVTAAIGRGVGQTEDAEILAGQGDDEKEDEG